jgi:hypothetical protein
LLVIGPIELAWIVISATGPAGTGATGGAGAEV